MNKIRIASTVFMVIVAAGQGRGSNLRARIATLEKDIQNLTEGVASTRKLLEKCSGIASTKVGSIDSTITFPKNMKDRVALIEVYASQARSELSYFRNYCQSLSKNVSMPSQQQAKKTVDDYREIQKEFREYRDWKKSTTIISARVQSGHMRSFSQPRPPDPEIEKYKQRLADAATIVYETSVAAGIFSKIVDNDSSKTMFYYSRFDNWSTSTQAVALDAMSNYLKQNHDGKFDMYLAMEDGSLKGDRVRKF